MTFDFDQFSLDPDAPTARSGNPHEYSRWADNDGVRLHYLDAALPGPGDGLLPLVFVPGFGEEALDHLDFIAAMAPRRVIVPDLRGRGPSGKPEAGYDLAPHVADLAAVIDAAELGRLHIASYSRGTAYALRWALDHPDRPVSITVAEYPAAQIAPPLEVIASLQARQRFGRPITDRIPAEIIAKVIEQAHTQLYYDELARLEAPLLVIHGSRKSSLVTDEAIAAYRSARPDAEFVVLDTGHDLWWGDREAVPRSLRDFIAATENRRGLGG